jgi:hypothetical protein
MPSGRLSVYWENHTSLDNPREYRLNFAERGGRGGAQRSKTIIGTENLRRYLISIQDPTMKTEDPEKRAEEWHRELHATHTLALDPVDLSEDHAREYRHSP